MISNGKLLIEAQNRNLALLTNKGVIKQQNSQRNFHYSQEAQPLFYCKANEFYVSFELTLSVERRYEIFAQQIFFVRIVTSHLIPAMSSVPV